MSETEVKEAAAAALTSEELAEIGVKPKKAKKPRKVTQVVLSLPQLKQVLKKTNGQSIDLALYEACVASKIEPPKKLVLTIKQIEAKALDVAKPQAAAPVAAPQNAERTFTVGQRVRVISPGWVGEGTVQSDNGGGIYTVMMLSGNHGGAAGSFSVRHLRHPITAANAGATEIYAVGNMMRITRGDFAGSVGRVTRLDSRNGRPWQVCIRIDQGRGEGQEHAIPVGRVTHVPFPIYAVSDRVRVLARNWAGEGVVRRLNPSYDGRRTETIRVLLETGSQRGQEGNFYHTQIQPISAPAPVAPVTEGALSVGDFVHVTYAEWAGDGTVSRCVDQGGGYMLYEVRLSTGRMANQVGSFERNYLEAQPNAAPTIAAAGAIAAARLAAIPVEQRPIVGSRVRMAVVGWVGEATVESITNHGLTANIRMTTGDMVGMRGGFPITDMERLPPLPAGTFEHNARVLIFNMPEFNGHGRVQQANLSADNSRVESYVCNMSTGPRANNGRVTVPAANVVLRDNAPLAPGTCAVGETVTVSTHGWAGQGIVESITRSQYDCTRAEYYRVRMTSGPSSGLAGNHRASEVSRYVAPAPAPAAPAAPVAPSGATGAVASVMAPAGVSLTEALIAASNNIAIGNNATSINQNLYGSITVSNNGGAAAAQAPAPLTLDDFTPNMPVMIHNAGSDWDGPGTVTHRDGLYIVVRNNATRRTGHFYPRQLSRVTS